MTQTPYDPFNRRRTTLRMIFFLIIVGTIPFYVVGFLLWATAPSGQSRNGGETSIVTNTPIGADATATNTLPPLPTQFPTRTPIGGGINPTPPQFVIPTSVFPTVVATNIPLPTATDFIIPTSTQAPTLTPIPSETPIPTLTFTAIPTETPLPPPSDTPTPTATEDTGEAESMGVITDDTE
jgi:hypothetical protein